MKTTFTTAPAIKRNPRSVSGISRDQFLTSIQRNQPFRQSLLQKITWEANLDLAPQKPVAKQSPILHPTGFLDTQQFLMEESGRGNGQEVSENNIGKIKAPFGYSINRYPARRILKGYKALMRTYKV